VSKEKSLLDYYVIAAVIAVENGIGLQYAFDRYVKPKMPNDVKPYTPDQAKQFCELGG
jgi:hypothetical protein